MSCNPEFAYTMPSSMYNLFQGDRHLPLARPERIGTPLAYSRAMYSADPFALTASEFAANRQPVYTETPKEYVSQPTRAYALTMANQSLPNGSAYMTADYSLASQQRHSMDTMQKLSDGKAKIVSAPQLFNSQGPVSLDDLQDLSQKRDALHELIEQGMHELNLN